jgi:threonine/homoserine/homoserine lactone efflux protein
MPLDMLLALIGFAFVMSLTPGPNNVMLLASGVHYGFVRTLPHMLGIGVGVVVMLLLVGAGLGQMLLASPLAYNTLKWISAAYLLWLAWKIATAGPLDASSKPADARPLSLFQAAAFQWVNPKAWAMTLTATTTYTVPSDFAASLIIMALVFGTVNFPSNSVWTLFGVALRGLLADPRRAGLFNAAMAAVLVASLVPMLR